MQYNLTNGNAARVLLSFSVPYMLSYFLQTFYGLADLNITGLYNGTASITAVSIGSQLMHMITVIIVGLTMGVTVSIARATGKNDSKQVNASIGAAVILFSVISVLMTCILLIFIRPIIRILSTPNEAVQGTFQYLAICFSGIPFITAFNVISSIFRGMGDSRSPMYYIAVSCVLNILLDFLLIGCCNMGVSGAALATVISQAVSVFLAMIFIKRRNSITFNKENLNFFSNPNIGYILKVGIPVAVQDGFIQIAFIVITIFANLRGINDAAAVGIVEKLICVMFIFPSSMLSSVSALAAQNIGAEKPVRAKQTLYYAILFCVLSGCFFVVISWCYAETLLGCFDKNPQVILSGSQYLRSYVWDCIFAGIHFCFSGYFCACARSGLSFLHNILSITLVRVPGAYMASVLVPDSLFPMGIAAPAGS